MDMVGGGGCCRAFRPAQVCSLLPWSLLFFCVFVSHILRLRVLSSHYLHARGVSGCAGAGHARKVWIWLLIFSRLAFSPVFASPVGSNASSLAYIECWMVGV